MNKIEAIILDIIQGLTEFLPVSSSGNLEIGHHLLGVKSENNLLFDVVVHGATVLSTIIIFRKDIWNIILGVLKFQWNTETKFFVKIILSMIPVAIAGIFFSDWVEKLFSGNLLLVGSMLLITALLLTFAYYKRPGRKKIPYVDSFIIGIAQMMAVIPGISRSGSTIATSLILGNKREESARFSFLMVIIPILGINFLNIISGDLNEAAQTHILPLAAGFVAAFISGLLACQWMLKIVKKGKLIYFAIYCLIIGFITIFAPLFF